MTTFEREYFVSNNMFPVKSLSDSKKRIIAMSDMLSESSLSIADSEQQEKACGGDFLVELNSIGDLKTFAKVMSDDIVIKVDKINGAILGLLVLNKEISEEDLEDLNKIFR